MFHRFLLALLFFFAPCFCCAIHAQTRDSHEPFVRRFDSSHPLSFEIVDHLKHPDFWWPRTLLSYPIRFESPGVGAEQLRLRNVETGQSVPFQLSGVRTDNGRLQFAVVHFFSDLPSGAARRFELLADSAPVQAQPPLLTQTHEPDSMVLAHPSLRVRIPTSRRCSAGQIVPGPIMQMDRGSGWIGASTIESPRRKVSEISTQVTEVGPCFAEARVRYTFDTGGAYIATIRLVDGYDFVEFDEEMIGLAGQDEVAMEIAWTDFHPTHRWSLGLRGILPIDQPRVQAFRGEDPAFTGPSQVEDPSKQMLMWMEITPSNGWSGWKEVDFWDQRTSQGVGLFISDVARWQDHEYPLWVSTDTLRPRFRFADGVLRWRFPLVTGTRGSGVVFAPHAKDESAADEEESTGASAKKVNPAIFRRSRYGDLSLNRLKDWVLDYPANAKTPAPLPGKAKKKDAASYDTDLAKCGTVLVAGGMYHPVALRDISAWLVPDFTRLAPSMSPAQRERATAMLLLSAYLSASEDYGPMITMLGGHPNFMADYKYPLMGVAYCFPDHPMAGEWRDQFEKFVDLTGRFYTRPAVPQWEALGGRWAESLATYTWAYLSPALAGNQLGIQSDGQNRMATPWLGMLGDYLVGVMTAPVALDAAKTTWPADTALTYENGFRRIHPPQGAHSGKRASPGSMYALGESLMRSYPLTAEHLMWGSWPGAGKGFEDRPADSPAGAPNHGTNPHLRSAKYTGYGIVLRAAVDTPDEISVFLQQIDKGPNYRWGYANQNGSGDIYYYAGGKSFSGHGFEDAGDRHADDAMYSCNSGVYKNYHFNCIGMNDLVQPFYDLDVAQFAQLVPEQGPGAYSWPEYKSRSVMLVGSDYIVVYDAIENGCGTRFAWNSSGVNDELPFIHHIKGGNENTMDTTSRARDKQRGVIYDVWKGGGDRMMLVTHKKEVGIIPVKREKTKPAAPFTHVDAPLSDDYLFQSSEPIAHQDPTISFHGRCGVIRRKPDRTTEMALFQGQQIGVENLTLKMDNAEMGVSVRFVEPTELKGASFGRQPGQLTIEMPRDIPSGMGLYVDGQRIESRVDKNQILVTLPAGEHRWQLTAKKPQPLPPSIIRTENRAGGATVFFHPVAGAEAYRVEISWDNGAQWEPAGQTAEDHFELSSLTNGIKVHARVLAINSDAQSSNGDDYPIYVTDQPPRAPDGLRVELAQGRARIAWGQVLGVSEYRLYRRLRGQGEFALIFKGMQNTFDDSMPGIVAPVAIPGVAGNWMRTDTAGVVCEYAISAVNGNGEGGKSHTIDTDPTRWNNWNPPVDLRFNRQSGYWRVPYVTPEQVPPRHYPSAEQSVR